jgi:hypothetical protein
MSLGSDREGKTLRWPVVHAAPPDKAQIKIPPFFRVSIAHAHAIKYCTQLAVPLFYRGLPLSSESPKTLTARTPRFT